MESEQHHLSSIVRFNSTFFNRLIYFTKRKRFSRPKLLKKHCRILLCDDEKKKKWFLFIDSPHTNFWLYIFINLSLPSPVCGDGETCPISLVVSHLSPRFYPLIFSIFLTRTVESLRINVEDTPPLLLASTSLPNCFFFFFFFSMECCLLIGLYLRCTNDVVVHLFLYGYSSGREGKKSYWLDG